MSRERRRLFPEEEPTAEPGRFGCPMLVRSRAGLAAAGALPPMLCSLGWALHDELDAARCRATDSVSDCWKMHPERTPMVALDGGEPGAVFEETEDQTMVAGD